MSVRALAAAGWPAEKEVRTVERESDKRRLKGE